MKEKDLFANNDSVYIAGRFVLGFGNSLSQMTSPLLLTEICHPQHRGPLTTVYNCLWNLGSLSRFSFKMKIENRADWQ